MINLEKLKNIINQVFDGKNLSQNRSLPGFDFHSMSDLLFYRSFDSQKEIFINDNSLGFILEGNLLIGANDGVIEAISGIFTDGIPEGCTVQFINWASPKVGDFFDSWRHSRDIQGGVYQKLADERIKFFKNANHKSLFDSSPYTLKNFRLIIAVSMPFRKKKGRGFIEEIFPFWNKSEESSIDEVTKELYSFREKFKTALNTAGIDSRNMNPEGLINFLDEIINFNTSPWKEKIPYDNLQSINRQIVDLENSLHVENDQLTLYADNIEKKTQVRSFSIRNFPNTWAQWQCRDLIGDFFQDLRRMEYPFLTFFSVTLPKGSEKLLEHARAKNFNATRLSSSEMARFIPEMKRSAQEWQFVNEKLNAGQKILKATYQVLVFAPEAKINEAEQTIKSIYKACGWNIARDKYLQLPSFLTVLPFSLSEGFFEDLEKLGRTKTMVSWTVANLAPLQGEWHGMNSPCMMLYGRRGQPFFWDPFANDEGNFNAIVVGRSGSGKSVFMQELVTSARGKNGIVYVIDDGRSFMNSCRLQGGEYIEFSDKAESPIIINPFSVVNPETMKKSPEYKTEVMGLITAIICQMCEGDPTKKDLKKLDPIQIRMIGKAIGYIWEKHGPDASITTVADHFKNYNDLDDPKGKERGRDLATLMEPFTKDGVYGRFFEGKSSIKLSNPFMVFETAELKNKKELQSIVVMFLTFMISEKMYFGDRKSQITLVIDEAWDLLHGEGSSVVMEGIARRARKYGANLVLGTQSINDFYKTPATIAVIENSDWSILLSQKAESISMLESSGKIALKEKPELKEALLSLRKVEGQFSEAIIYGPKGWAIGRLILDKYSLSLYSSTASDWSRINELKGQGYELAEALAQLANEKTKSSKLKLLNPADYRLVIDMTKKEEDRISYEDAFEMVVEKKIQMNFPIAYQEIYSQETMRLQ
jgi:conjugal transfer ATP-binding protein TraC